MVTLRLHGFGQSIVLQSLAILKGVPIVIIIFLSIGLGDLVWWRWADFRLRRAFRPSTCRVWARGAVAVFMVSHLLFLTTLLMGATFPKQWGKMVPMPFVADVYIWSLLVLPVCIVAICSAGVVRIIRSLLPTGQFIRTGAVSAGQKITRRQMLTATAVALPPLVAAGTVARAIPQLSEFRIRRLQVRLPGLPPALNGLRIAHVSDLHVGRYTRSGMLPRVAATVNALDADLILFTGDLIDFSLDDLPRGIDTLKQMQSKFGMFLIEGNHDLIQAPDAFDSGVREAGLTLLLDDAVTIPVYGEHVQILGTRWGVSTGDRRRAGPKAFEDSVAKVSKLRDTNAFPILMAHHPHTFDAALAAGFPLTLSGHTHGGLLNFNSQIGFGPVFYRYWSGLYKKPQGQLVVSNGIGNWFPLRINTPAEIIDLTLRA